MKRNEFIKNIMTKNIVTVDLTDNLSVVRQKMDSLGVHHIPVVEGTRLRGIISRVDILKHSPSTACHSNGTKSAAVLDKDLTAEEIMTKKVMVLSENNTVREASEILTTSNFNSLPVINPDNALLGLITTKDLLGYLLDQY